MTEVRRLYDHEAEELIPLPDDPTHLRGQIALRDAEVRSLRDEIRSLRERLARSPSNGALLSSLAGARHKRRQLAKALDVEKSLRRTLELRVHLQEQELQSWKSGVIGRLLRRVGL